MSERIAFTVLGTPIGKARPRVTRWGAYTPEKTKIAEDSIRYEYVQLFKHQQFAPEIALRMVIDSYMPIPESTSIKNRMQMLNDDIRPTKKPDWDNLGKLVSDALNSIAYHDDKQIVECTVRKYYSSKPRLEIVIEECR